MARIVVGIDGSENAEQALRFALEEARLRGATLELVCAWEVPSLAYSGGYAPATLGEDLESDARKLLEEAAERCGTVVPIELRAVKGQAADALMHAAEGADLLVVGSRGHGGFTRLLLGSVSQQVAHHTRVPLAIVPPSGR